MKNLLFVFSIISLGLLSSCSKDDSGTLSEENPSPSANATQKVVLSISNLNETGNLTRAVIADPSIKKVGYAVFKTGENVLSGDEELVFQDSIIIENDPVSAINLDLQPGKYLIAVFASGKRGTQINSNGGYGDANAAKLLKNLYLSAPEMASPSEFYGTTNVEVSEQSVTANVTLQRIVGKVEIVIKDLNNLPANITSVTAALKTFTFSKNWYNVAPTGMYLKAPHVSTFAWTADDFYDKLLKLDRNQFAAHNEDNPLTFYCLQTVNGVTTQSAGNAVPYLYLYLNPGSATEAANRILIATTVQVQPNKITRYIGTIVGSTTQGFNMSVADQWGTDTETVIVDKIL